MIRVFLLDDHEVVRRGVRELLDAEADIEVVGEAGTAEEALARIPATRPTSPFSTSASRTATASRSAGRSGRIDPRSRASCSPRSPTTRRSSTRSWPGPPGYLLKQIRGTDLVDAVARSRPALAARPGGRPRRCWSGCAPDRRRRALARLTEQERRSSSSSPRA